MARTFIVADAHHVGALGVAERPDALHAVVERVLQAVGGVVPDPHGSVLGARHDDRKLRVEHHRGHVVRVPLERLHARLGLVVPHFHLHAPPPPSRARPCAQRTCSPKGLCDAYQLVVGAGDEVGAVAAGEVVDAVDALLVAFEREVRLQGAEGPHLDGAVQRRGGEGVRVLGVEDHLHHVVRVPLEHLRARPVLVPVPGGRPGQAPRSAPADPPRSKHASRPA
eukprot:scaffold4781_cov339-Prasinococcus_capsulatus_cf.AAC.10